jgi:hypothetical protein
VFVGEYMSCLKEDTCRVCRRVHVIFVGGYMSLQQTRHVPSKKYDMHPPTNTTCILLQKRHVPFYKDDMYPPTNMYMSCL